MEHMFERIDPRSSTPLYAQIAARLKVAVAAGELSSGDPLPSVRQLAHRLRLNPATVVQAYRELEAEGFVEMRQGAGTFVRDVTPERRGRERAEHATRLVRTLLADAAKHGLGREDIIKAFDQELGVKTHE
ncbi:MAG TPA: GntR family transcriptional regulator [Gemmatimonadales bacterium]|nr:GntR family transcriptional regulator [Gemmatimonadales bacterium]